MALSDDDHGYHYCRFLRMMIRLPDEIQALLKEHSKYSTIDEFCDALMMVLRSKQSLADLEKELDMTKKLWFALDRHAKCYLQAIREFDKSILGFYMELLRKVPCYRKVAQYVTLFTFPLEESEEYVLFPEDAQELGVDKEEAARLLDEFRAKASEIEAKLALEIENSRTIAKLKQVVCTYSRQLQKKLEGIKIARVLNLTMRPRPWPRPEKLNKK